MILNRISKLILILVQYNYSAVLSAPAKNVQISHPFVGFFVFPHGGITLNPQIHDFSEDGGFRPGKSREEAIRLHEGMSSAAKALMEMRPDVIILSTPHGYYLDKSFVFVGNPTMTGNAGWEWANFSATLNIAQKETIDLYSTLRKQNNPVQLLSFGIGESAMDLKWGEVIPWTFIQDASIQLGIPLPDVIYVGQPPTRNMSALSKFGKDLATFVKTSASSLKDKRVVLLVSGDLSHYHSNDTRAPYPYHPNSAIFDAQIIAWGSLDRTRATEEKATEYILTGAGSVADSAGSCGYSGLVMMHSVISSLVVDDDSRFSAKFYGYAAPTYFGMMVASWLPKQE